MKLGVFLVAASAMWAQPAPTCNLVPGWQQKGAARSFTAENLFEYMDGNAEGYLIYGFVKMNGVTCTKGEDTFVFDVSEMVNPDSAYGIFTSNRDPDKPEEKLGMAGQVLPRRGTFVKGKYYVEIAADPEKDHTANLRAFIAAFEPKVEGSTTLPESLSWFPAEQRTGLRLVPESVLGLRLLKRGYVGQYAYGKAFLVKEATPDSARGVMEKLRARFGEAAQSATVGDEAIRVSEKYLGRLCFFRKGQYLGGWANVAEPKDACTLAGELAAKVK